MDMSLATASQPHFSRLASGHTLSFQTRAQELLKNILNAHEQSHFQQVERCFNWLREAIQELQPDPALFSILQTVYTTIPSAVLAVRQEAVERLIVEIEAVSFVLVSKYFSTDGSAEKAWLINIVNEQLPHLTKRVLDRLNQKLNTMVGGTDDFQALCNEVQWLNNILDEPSRELLAPPDQSPAHPYLTLEQVISGFNLAVQSSPPEKVLFWKDELRQFYPRCISEEKPEGKFESANNIFDILTNACIELALRSDPEWHPVAKSIFEGLNRLYKGFSHTEEFAMAYTNAKSNLEKIKLKFPNGIR